MYCVINIDTNFKLFKEEIFLSYYFLKIYVLNRVSSGVKSHDLAKKQKKDEHKI